MNAYESKTKMTRAQISQLMGAESCFNTKKAVELGFADWVLYSETQPTNNSEPVIYHLSTFTILQYSATIEMAKPLTKRIL